MNDLQQDHERILVSQWSAHRDECIKSIAWKMYLLGMVIGYLFRCLL